MSKLIINIQQLVGAREENQLLRGKALAELPAIENAFILIEDGIIADYGNMYELELKVPQLPKHIIKADGSVHVLDGGRAGLADSRGRVHAPAVRADRDADAARDGHGLGLQDAEGAPGVHHVLR